MCGFQMTFAQLAGMCKGHCMCLPLLDFIVGFLKEGVSVTEPLYVSFDTPILELSYSLDKVVIHGQWPQKNSFKPQWEWLDRLRGGVWLGIYFEDVGRRTWAIVIAETSNGTFIQGFDPLTGRCNPMLMLILSPGYLVFSSYPLGHR